MADMAEFHIPLTLVVRADSVQEAQLVAARFEKFRETFGDETDFAWLYIGLSDEAKDNERTFVGSGLATA